MRTATIGPDLRLCDGGREILGCYYFLLVSIIIMFLTAQIVFFSFGLERSGSGNGSCSGWVEYEDLRPKTHK